MDCKPTKDRCLKEINMAGKTAKFYGFWPIVPPAVEKKDFDFTENLDESYHPVEKAALLRMYLEEKMTALLQPAMLWCERPFPKSKENKKPHRLECILASIGSIKSVCECLSMQAGIAILNSAGYKNLEIEINSIGDRDSTNEFQKKLAAFVRKNIASFSPALRQAVKKDHGAVLKKASSDEWPNLQSECPKSMDFLSEQSRLHFKEILEFLEIMEIPYSINHRLIGDINIGTETIFSIKSGGNELAHGFRFNRLAKMMGHKKDLPCTTLNISAKLKNNLKSTGAREVKPQFYLVQFGPEAKLKSFIVLRELHKTGVCVAHLIAKDKLGSQINVAESSGVPHIILMGQKEALENSVVIRDTATRAQELVPISELASKVKELI